MQFDPTARVLVAARRGGAVAARGRAQQSNLDAMGEACMLTRGARNSHFVHDSRYYFGDCTNDIFAIFIRPCVMLDQSSNCVEICLLRRCRRAGADQE